MGVRIFVGNLNLQTTKSQVEQFFSDAGRVVTISIPVSRDTGQPRGFCFVEFADRDAATEAFALCDRRELDGHRLRLSWARDRDEGGGDRRVERKRSPRDFAAVRGSDGSEETASRRDSRWSYDYAEERWEKPRRHGRHGSDRKRQRGTRRVIE